MHYKFFFAESQKLTADPGPKGSDSDGDNKPAL